MHSLKKLSTKMIFEVTDGDATRWQVSVAGRIRASSGRIWLTRQNDPQDYWLDSDTVLTVQPGDVLWLGADAKQGAAQLELSFDATRALDASDYLRGLLHAVVSTGSHMAPRSREMAGR